MSLIRRYERLYNVTPAWQQQISDSITEVSELLERVDIAGHSTFDDKGYSFPLKAPDSWLQRIEKNHADDPLLRQVLPSAEECKITTGFSKDPVGDLRSNRGNGIIHKYHGRVLFIVTQACAIHCRYCFRRHFPYHDNTLASHIDAAISAIAQATDISEVILSGGDPLTLSNPKLFDLCQRLEAIPHIRRIRIHTRVPVAIPARIDPSFVEWSKQRDKRYIMVLHINHPNEIDQSVYKSMEQLKHWTLLNQAVLLKGVNDNSDALIQLSLRCFEAGILPYYLHLLDRVEGAAHFEVDEARACELMRTISSQLPGYLIPKLVRECAGEVAKRIIPY